MGSTVWLMVASKTSDAKRDLPGGPVPVVSPCQPTPLQEASNMTGCCCAVSYEVTAPLFWVLVHPQFCLCPPRVESLFHSFLWKAYNQIPLALKARFPGDSQSLCQIPNWEAWLGPCEDSEPSQWCKDFFSFIVLQSVGHPPGSYGIWFDRDCTTDTMSYLTLRFPLCLWTWGIFFCGFQCPPVDGCSTVSCNFGALADRDEHRCFYSAILNWNLRTISLIIRTLVGKVMFLLFNMSSRFVIAFFLRRKAKVKVTQLCLILCNPGQNSPGQNTRVGSRSLLQGIFPTQGLNPGLPYCRQILYQLSQQGRKCLWISWLFSLSCDFGAPQNEICHCFHCFPTYFPWSDGTGCHDLSFFNVDF